jgi:hypothetical protein
MLPSQQELSSLLGTLYDAATDPSLWNPFIQGLAKHRGATSAALLIHDLKHSKYSFSTCWCMNSHSARLYQAYHSLVVWAQRGRGHSAGYVCASQSLCTLPEMKTTEIL